MPRNINHDKHDRKRHSAIHPMVQLSGVDPREVAVSLFADLGSPLSIEAAIALVVGNDNGYIDLSIDPSDYTDVRRFKDDYFALNYLRKWPGLSLGIDTRHEALTAFLSAEDNCKATNHRIRNHLQTSGSLVSCLTPQSLIHSAREKVSRVLGDFSWEECSEHFSFGNGATASLPRRKGDAYYKFGEETPTCTLMCLPVAIAAIRMSPRWTEILTGFQDTGPDSIPRLREVIRVVAGNRLDFVPKNAKTDRTIAIEPTLNGYVQRGIGTVIRRRLKKVGIDLHDQKSNQRAARWGSITGLLATVDLSAASDSVSIELVKELIPPDWFDAIMLTRSPLGELPDGTLIEYQKVSSMGNGFTFELESLLFWALAKAAVDLVSRRKRRVRIYGDDIIVPSSAVPTLRFILEYCGFSFNSEKSFWSGPFRESCGKHYFLGYDVTPLFFSETRMDNWAVVKMANQLRRWSRLSHYGKDVRVKDTYDKLVSSLPSRVTKHRIPDGIGDYALIASFDEALPRWNVEIQSFQVRFDVPFKRVSNEGEIPLLVKSTFLLKKGGRDLQDDLFHLLLGLRQKWDVQYATDGFGFIGGNSSIKWIRMKEPLCVRSWPDDGPWF